MSEYKKKGIDYDNKIKYIGNENIILGIANKIKEKNLEYLKKNLVLKDEAIKSVKERKTLMEQKCNDIRSFILRNANPEVKKKFTQEGF